MNRESQEERLDRLVWRLLAVAAIGAALFGLMLVVAVVQAVI